jgi:hypothetical protein
MNDRPTTTCAAFHADRLIASGELREVVQTIKKRYSAEDHPPVQIFDDATGALIDVDFHGTLDDVLGRSALTPHAEDRRGVPAEEEGAAPRSPGRPKLGVVAREVTLLPRHWEWLSVQPGGASVALRKLVEAARHSNEEEDRRRRRRDAAYRFMASMAGDRPGFEEASRALFAGDLERFDDLVDAWPIDIRDHARRLAIRDRQAEEAPRP